MVFAHIKCYWHHGVIFDSEFVAAVIKKEGLG